MLIKLKPNTPKYKKDLITAIMPISEDRDFLLAIVSAAGQTEQNAKKMIDFVSTNKPDRDDALIYALEIHYSKV